MLPFPALQMPATFLMPQRTQVVLLHPALLARSSARKTVRTADMCDNCINLNRSTSGNKCLTSASLLHTLDFRKDTVRFNEVAQEPPQFKTFARKAVGLEDAGKRRAKDLKLASMLPSSALRARPGQEKKTKAPKPAPARQVRRNCREQAFRDALTLSARFKE